MSVKSMLVDAFYSLERNVNKRKGDASQETAEGVVGMRLPELELEMDSEDLVKLSDTWEKAWKDSDVRSKWEARGDDNEKYWLGEHFERAGADKSRPMVDNAIFEGLETYLPQVTRRNPEPMVSLKQGEPMSEPNMEFAHALQLELGELADDIKLRLKLKDTARNWSLRLLGAVKLGWDLDNDRPAVKVIRPSKLILDPDSTVDADGYTGERIGEHRKLPAWKIVAFIKKEKDSTDNISYITTDLCRGDMATEIGFIEWWTADYMFWKINSRILMKRKNPHWNYETETNTPEASSVGAEGVQTAPAPEMTQETMPALPQGAPAVPQLQPQQAPQAPTAINHFMVRKMPYILLSIFNLGKYPVDQTSNIGQNLANQDIINKRNKQIDKNADTANNGLVVSLERSGLTKDQASGVTAAIRKGGVVAIPAGAPQEAIYKPAMNELPAFVYNNLVDTRNRVRDIWGTRGSSPAGIQNETTVRGKFMVKGLDTDRVGGGISEYLEQFSDDIYNWLAQLLYVYDLRFLDAAAKGTPIPKVKISVKEGSLLPKDSATIANQAIELSTGGKMSTLDLYKRLDYPNPEELAANVWLETNAPDVLYANDPRIKQVMQARQAVAAQGAGTTEKRPPSVSINYKDLPPEGQAQAAAEAGITLHPEGIAAHAENKLPPAEVPPGSAGP